MQQDTLIAPDPETMGRLDRPAGLDLQPGRAGTAYGQMIRQTETPRDIELRVFAQITAEMESVTPDMAPGERGRIIGRNAELWSILSWCSIDDANQMPPQLRANIVGLGRFVEQRSGQVLRDNASLAGLIEINKTIMLGLAASPAPANPEGAN